MIRPLIALLVLLSISIYYSHAEGIDTSGDQEDHHECTNNADVIEQIFQDPNHKLKSSLPHQVKVGVKIYIQKLLDVSDSNDDMTFDAFIFEDWLDERLKYDHLNPCQYNISIDDASSSKLWTPSIIAPNAKEFSVHQSPTRNAYFSIMPNGTVWNNYRARLTIPCESDYSRFPFDTKLCFVDLESYKYNSDLVALRWADTDFSVAFFDNVRHEFFMSEVTTQNKIMHYPNGNWVSLFAKFHWRRSAGYYLLHAYIPSILIMIVSWISIAFGPGSVTARAVLNSVVLLVLIILSIAIKRDLPKINFATAFDIWILTCISLVVLTLIEMAIVAFLSGHGRGSIDRGRTSNSNQYLSIGAESKLNATKVAFVVDAVMFFVFFVLFAVFNIVYWTYW